MKNTLKKILIISLIMLSNLFGTFFHYANATTSNNLVIVLDPGHGPTDPGAIGNGLQEREVNFKIAKYLKEELEAKNSNISVYLTHNGNFSDPKLELSERANIAAALGADIVISLHINASTDTAINGAEVFVTRDTSEDRYNKNCKILGNLILGELAKLGIDNRGAKNSPVGNTTTPNDREYYDSGIEVDYYGMIRYPRKLEIPGIIVEHCFISNAEDVQKYISTDEQIREIAKADADGILAAVANGYITKKEANEITDDQDMEDWITSTVYIVTNGTIIKISNETTVEEFINNISIFEGNEDSIKILNKDGTQLKDNDVIGTGMKLVSEGNAGYDLIVAGDTTGSGTFTITDLSRMISHRIGEDVLKDAYQKALDVNYDGKITITDLSIMIQVRIDGTKF